MREMKIAIIGMGGFAGAHHKAVLELEAAGECKLIAASGRTIDAMQDKQQELRFKERGVRTFSDWVEMLDTCREDLDVVAVPTPIQMHAPMHRACVERNLPVYLEKPPTLNPDELDSMIEIEKQALKGTTVAFNHIVEEDRQQLKRRILDGDFGKVRRVSVLGLSPRVESYYTRNSWAGRLLLDGDYVLDSPIGNAMAHHAHDGLFWAGTDSLWSWGEVNGVKAELYRAHAIQGLDTLFIKADIAQGPELCIAQSHACANIQTIRERIECENACINYRFDLSDFSRMHWEGSIRWKDGREESWKTDNCGSVASNMKAYFDFLRRELPRPTTRLADCKPFVHLNALMYVASGKITTVPMSMVGKFPLPDGTGDCLNIQDIIPVSERFIETGDFPSVQGAPWAAPGGQATPADLPKLMSTIEAMAGMSVER